MNKTVTKTLILIVLFSSVWQLNLLVEKLKPLAVNIGRNITEVPNQITSQDLTYTAQEDIPPTEEVKLVPERIEIEKVGINLPIVSVGLKDGTWEVVPKVANYALETSRISPTNGNVGIYGHDTDDTFSKIKELVSGDKIEIFSGDMVASYEVSLSSVVSPDRVDVFFATEEPILTLITCDGVYSEARYIVVSKLISITEYEKELL